MKTYSQIIVDYEMIVIKRRRTISYMILNKTKNICS
jgi:hypothetical protein